MQNYSRKKKELVMQRKIHYLSSEEICIGSTLEIIKDPVYNKNMHKRLKEKFGHKTNGCEIEITEVSHISNHGRTLPREFK